MVNSDATTKSFPWGKLPSKARLKRAAADSYFTRILWRIRTMYHFAQRFSVSCCIPPPSSAPASRGTFPWGKVLAVACGCTIQLRIYRTALREREDDILPYGGWGILAGTVQPGLRIALVHATPHQPRCARQLPPGGSRGGCVKMLLFLPRERTGWVRAGAGFVEVPVRH